MDQKIKIILHGTGTAEEIKAEVIAMLNTLVKCTPEELKKGVQILDNHLSTRLREDENE